MAGRPDTIMAAHRDSNAPDGEPLITDTRIVRDMKRQPDTEPDPGVNLASMFREVADIDVGDEVFVEVYRDKYVIHAPASDE